jgi:hypothetical protein
VLDTASAGASGTVTVDDQRSHIKIETLCGKTPTEIHTALREVCGEQTADRSILSYWATRFREERVTIKDDPRPGWPKTSTDERSVKLVADFLAEYRPATCEEISQGTGISSTSVFRILTNVYYPRNYAHDFQVLPTRPTPNGSPNRNTEALQHTTVAN